MRQLPDGDATPRRMCELCLALLSTPTAHREAVTHASAVLVHLAMASWRASNPRPLDAATLDPAKISNASNAPGVRRQGGESIPECNKTAAAISESFFAEPEEQRDDYNDDTMSALLLSSMPLPPSSGLAVCRALLNIVDPCVLLASCDLKRPSFEGLVDRGRGNLFLGPILHEILRRSGADSHLQLRFFALQVGGCDNNFHGVCGSIPVRYLSPPQWFPHLSLRPVLSLLSLVCILTFEIVHVESSSGRPTAAVLWRGVGCNMFASS